MKSVIGLDVLDDPITGLDEAAVDEDDDVLSGLRMCEPTADGVAGLGFLADPQEVDLNHMPSPRSW